MFAERCTRRLPRKTLFHRIAPAVLAFGLLAALGCSDSSDTTTQETPSGRLDIIDLETRAERGDPAAQYALGMIYVAGDGVAADPARARQWMHESAEQGYAPAQYELGSFYTLEGPQQDFTRAADWLRRAAEQNYLRAQTSLGMLYAAGRGVEQDFAEAFAWLTLASDSGNEPATKMKQQLLDVITEDEFSRGLQLIDRYRTMYTADHEP